MTNIMSQQERFYFGDSVLPCFESGIPLLKSRLQELPDSQNVGTPQPSRQKVLLLLIFDVVYNLTLT
jgi:hypothetical protein